MDRKNNNLRGAKNIRRIIKLHQTGYAYDFQLIFPNKLICLQESLSFRLKDVDICVLDQLFDDECGEYKYIHSIDTCCGYRGLMLSREIITSLGVS